MRKLLVATLFAMGAPATHGADWVLIDGAGNSIAFMDTQSIAQTADRLTKAWVTYNYSEPQTLPGYPSQEYMSIATLHYFNCAERTSAILQEVLYGEPGRAGKTIQHITNDRKSLVLRDVIPDSIGESLLKYACNYKKVKRKK